ncbi:hypothetical protein LR48_Vigan10g264500 [Vigna angularis]|uniref:Myb/SANT-like domain-containing protein n=1 Tax=Phaseolus angularis TaxID=3914 RepID=A0A0L9VP69_PHAAN|nr:hypothetical protein LR48_Vigan10g264500 [Vigna angularis]
MKKQRLEEEDESACLRAEEDDVQCRKRVAYSVIAEPDSGSVRPGLFLDDTVEEMINRSGEVLTGWRYCDRGGRTCSKVVEIANVVERCVSYGRWWRYEMNRGKATAIESSTPTREFMKWTEDMDSRLLHSMIEESRIGNRVDESWTSQAYSNIVDHLHSSGYVAITKNNVKNRQKVLKDKWREVHDLFSGLSGFAWNPVSMTFQAEDDVWMDLI